MERFPQEHKEPEQTRYGPGSRAGGQETDPDRPLWRQFAEAVSPKEFCQSWLPLQCRILKGVRCAMVLLGNADQGPYSPVAVWPDAKLSMVHLTGAAQRALKERRGLLLESDSAAQAENILPESYHVAYPIEVSKKLHGVVVLEIEQHSNLEIQAVMRQLHWGAAWLEVLIRRTEGVKSEKINERLQKVLDLVATVVEHDTFYASAMAFVNRLATTLDCDRVSLGVAKGRHVKVGVLSHSSDFGGQSNLMRAIGAAMDEAADQHAVVTYPLPPEETPLVTKSHENMSRQHGSGTILTIPMEDRGRLLGALTLERSEDKPFDKETVEACETTAALVAPVLENKRLDERWLLRKAVDSFGTQLKRMLGPGHLVRKLVLLLILAMIAFFDYAEIDYRISAPTSLEGSVQRVVAAPFNGYIKEASARPGDLVKAGDVLCSLDDRDLKLERLRWSTEKEQLVKQYHEAMAKHERSQIRIIRAKIDQAEAQISLLDEQLARTKIPAPFNGIIMSGDLSQSLGAPVERGQVLFQVTPLDEYRVIIEVDERDITELAKGQHSELVLPSMPGEVFPFVVETITPVSTAKEGRNYFRVEGRMEKISTRLRPGMEGIAKINIDRRKLIWVWTHQMIDWLRLQYWRWWP
ncbi:MAG: efflux RND transporter periplasmic adaptor subunit [Desulfobacterales bacterium]|nr:efflux RND transporter periplasmic adaptor subunit [Desulfobacterales bacterium]